MSDLFCAIKKDSLMCISSLFSQLFSSVFIILTCTVFTSTYVYAAENKNPTNHQVLYYSTHGLTTLLSYGTAFILAPAIQFAGSLALFSMTEKRGISAPYALMPYLGLIVAASVIYKTPQWTDKGLYKAGILEKSPEYTQEKALVQGLGRLAMGAILYRYGTRSINLFKTFLRGR
jgi:hypothetical protein